MLNVDIPAFGLRLVAKGFELGLTARNSGR